MKWVISLLAVMLIALQYKLWVGDGGIPDVLELQHEITSIQLEKLQLEERNESLHAEVSDLKKGLDAIEERARSELGMIGKDEVFYQIIPAQINNKN